ncbi:MAG: helix-turn-helix domain-containing protein [Deltaproteobacteria bacterium]|nr:helix-turn-helix domain-containing protein [Deltaproteobacteria bacterium]
MSENRHRIEVTTGIDRLDQILGGMFIGDNVVWFDDSGSLAASFWLRFVQSSLKLGKHVIFVSFDRSPKNLFERLGSSGEHKHLAVLDCFTYGKGKGISTFLQFLENAPATIKNRVVSVPDPSDISAFSEELYGLQARMPGDVRLVFESLTGMQELWGGEEKVIAFYGHSCPRLYDLSTIAYWVLERGAHSRRMRAAITQIAQVAVGLAIRRGTTSLEVIKAEDRQPLGGLQHPHRYKAAGAEIVFAGEKVHIGGPNLGARIKKLRVRRGLSQAGLARLVGVTPSTISQVESNTIFPSIPGLMKMAEVLAVEPGYLFGPSRKGPGAVFSPSSAAEVRLPNLPPNATVRSFLPLGVFPRTQAYLVEIPPKTEIHGHFLACKGMEVGYLAEGELALAFADGEEPVRAGDLVCLTDRMPTGWKNPGPDAARLVWIQVGDEEG